MNKSVSYKSVSSSFEDNDSIDSRTVRKSLKQISSVSIRSISEIISEQTESSKEITKKYSEDFENSEYSESFESSETTTKSSSSIRKSNSTIDSISSEVDTIESSTTTSSNDTYLNELKKSDYIKFVKAKLELEQNRKQKTKRKVKTHNKQINKLIERIHKYSKKSNEEKVQNDNFKIEPYLLNRLKTKQFIKDLGNEQLIKVESFGDDIVEHVNKEDIDKVYFKTKCDLIRYNTAKSEFETNQIDYCDGIIKIGILARDLPKLTDDPDVIWAKLLEPLNINKK